MIGIIATYKNSHCEALKLNLEKEENATLSVAAWLGDDKFLALLNLTRCRNEEDLNIPYPVYLAMAKASNAEKMKRFHSAINGKLDDHDITGSPCLCAPTILINFLSMKWYTTYANYAVTGWFRNPLLFGAQNEE